MELYILEIYILCTLPEMVHLYVDGGYNVL